MPTHLIDNFAVLGCFALVWASWQDWALHRPYYAVRLALGGWMGVASIATMALGLGDPADIAFTALPTVPIAIATLCGEPLAGIVAGAIAGAFWLLFREGLGEAAAYGIGTGFIAGLAVWHLSQRGASAKLIMPVLAVTTGLCHYLASLLGTTAVGGAPPDASAITPALLATLQVYLAATFIAHSKDLAQARALMFGAIMQAPEFLFVKDRRGRIVAANANIAKANGYGVPEEIVGKSDRDLSDPARAAELRSEELVVMARGEPLRNKLEVIDEGNGPRTYLTSKSPVRLADGEVIGVVGVTKDISDLKAKEEALKQSRDRLAFVLDEMSEGVALISHDGTYVLSNARYRGFFPRTGSLRVSGASFPAILWEVIRSGEQPVVVEGGNSKAWIDKVMGEIREGGDEIVQLFDGRWLHKRIRSHPSGISTIVVSDITDSKRTEIDLLAKARKLEVLASTDGLTHITNRRGFDEVMERQVAVARRSGSCLSVLLLDVDHFKAFNDRYGHQAGDDCLRAIAKAASSALRRPDDLLARYGGEEFALVLPDTSAEGALNVADAVMAAVAALDHPHEGSRKGIVSVSVGSASMQGRDPEMSVRTILARADEALYEAKGAGRDRAMAWQAATMAKAAIA